MIYEIKPPKSISNIVDFTYNYDNYKKRDMHGSSVGQIVKLLTGEETQLHTDIRFKQTIEYAMKNNIRIINASLHVGETATKRKLLKEYYEWGGIYIAAVGNNSGSKVTFPARSPYTLGVSATNDSDCDGIGIDVTMDSWWDVYAPNGQIQPFNGTSCADPVMSSCVSLMLKKYPQWHLDEVKEFIRDNSIPLEEEYERFFRFPDGFGEEVVDVKTVTALEPAQLLGTGTFVVPFRAIFEALDASEINWGEKNGKVFGYAVIELKNKKVKVTITQDSKDVIVEEL